MQALEPKPSPWACAWGWSICKRFADIASAATGAAAAWGETSGESARRSVAGRLTGAYGRNRHQVCGVADKADRSRQRRQFAVLHGNTEYALDVAHIGAFERSREGP